MVVKKARKFPLDFLVHLGNDGLTHGGISV